MNCSVIRLGRLSIKKYLLQSCFALVVCLVGSLVIVKGVIMVCLLVCSVPLNFLTKPCFI